MVLTYQPQKQAIMAEAGSSQKKRRIGEANDDNADLFEVEVPQGVKPRETFIIIANGQRVTLTCPPTAAPGFKVRFRLPKSYAESTASSEVHVMPVLGAATVAPAPSEYYKKTIISPYTKTINSPAYHQLIHTPTSIEPCSMNQMQHHISLLQSEIEEYQELIEMKMNDMEHTIVRMEYLKSVPNSTTNCGGSDLLVSKEYLIKTITESIDSKFGPGDFLGSSSIQNTLEEMKYDIVGKIESSTINSSALNMTGQNNNDQDNEEDENQLDSESDFDVDLDGDDGDEALAMLSQGRQQKDSAITITTHTLPSNWCYPKSCTVIQLIKLWLLGDKESHIPPLCTVYKLPKGQETGRYNYMCPRVMQVVEQLARKRNVWYLAGSCEWNEDRVKQLWEAIQPDLDPYMRSPNAIKRNKINARYYKSLTGEVPCSTVYTNLSLGGAFKTGWAFGEKGGIVQHNSMYWARKKKKMEEENNDNTIGDNNDGRLDEMVAKDVVPSYWSREQLDTNEEVAEGAEQSATSSNRLTEAEAKLVVQHGWKGFDEEGARKRIQRHLERKKKSLNVDDLVRLEDEK